MKVNFYSYVDKTHFQVKGFTAGPILKVWELRKDLTPKQQLKMFTCFMLPSFKASLTSIRSFPLAFTFFKVSIAHLRNLVQKKAYFDTVSSVALPPAWQPFLFFSGHCSGAR